MKARAYLQELINGIEIYGGEDGGSLADFALRWTESQADPSRHHITPSNPLLHHQRIRSGCFRVLPALLASQKAVEKLRLLNIHLQVQRYHATQCASPTCPGRILRGFGDTSSGYIKASVDGKDVVSLARAFHLISISFILA